MADNLSQSNWPAGLGCCAMSEACYTNRHRTSAYFGSAVQVHRKSILRAALLMCPPPTWEGLTKLLLAKVKNASGRIGIFWLCIDQFLLFMKYAFLSGERWTQQPPIQQFCCVIESSWKDMSFCIIPYRNHILRQSITSFFQRVLVRRQNCLSGGEGVGGLKVDADRSHRLLDSPIAGAREQKWLDLDSTWVSYPRSFSCPRHLF